MGVAQLPRSSRGCAPRGRAADHPVAVIERATLPEQRLLRGTLADIARARAGSRHVEPPALLIVGAVAALASRDALTALASPAVAGAVA